MGDSSNTSTTCTSHLCIRDTSSTNIYPWLINNVQAKFIYVRTDSIDYAVYRYLRQYNGQTLTYWLHMYDEVIFYNGFWVVNDLEDGYEEVEGRVFIYNSENDKCPQDTKNYCTSGREGTGCTTLTSTWRSARCSSFYTMMTK